MDTNTSSVQEPYQYFAKRSSALRDEINVIVVAEARISEAITNVHAIIHHGLAELQELDGYEHCQQLVEVERPPVFDEWVGQVDFKFGAEEIKAIWKIDTVCSAIDPIDRTTPNLCRARTLLRKSINKGVRTYQSDWSISENLRALQQDLKEHRITMVRVVQSLLQPTLAQFVEIASDIVQSAEKVDSALLERFEGASDGSRFNVIARLWHTATDRVETDTWEESTQAEALRTLRILFQTQLTRPILKVRDLVQSSYVDLSALASSQ